MKKFFEWLGVQNTYEKGLIARILVILCLAFVISLVWFLLPSG